MTDPLFARPAGGVARIALPVPIDSLFSYRLSSELAGRVVPGCRALVPFSGRSLTGVVVEVQAIGDAPSSDREDAAAQGAEQYRTEEDPASLSDLEQLLDEVPLLSASFMRVLMEEAEDVLCPVGLALAAALPAGSTPRVVRAFELTPRGREALRSGAVHGPSRALLELLASGPADATRVARRVPSASALLEALSRDGLLRRCELLRAPAARVARQRVARLAAGIDVDRACMEQLARAPKQAALLRALAEQGRVPVAKLAERTGSGSATLRALLERGLVEVERIAAPRDVLGPAVARDSPLELTKQQAAALLPIVERIEQRQAETFLLHGVTGSGKTEVYLRAIDRALELGRQALVLVPEISLTHQIVARLRARFGDQLAVLHSGLRPGERLEQWLRLRSGDMPIAVGARSALFAPLEDLGVIVIDEEHDGAYKNEEGFRYHARRLAERRAREAGCPLVLGSATPALETRHRAERGEIRRLVLERRIGGRPLPAVELVDMAAERRRATRGRKQILSQALRRGLKQALAEGGQSILFLNRRGFSTRIFCFDCGHAEHCHACDVALVYHAAEHRLACHYCEFEKPPPETCGGCGNPDTALLGIGTERLEEEVRRLFPDARLARLDRDTAKRRGHVESVLEGLRRGEFDILIGTQMVAKGHDLPGVRLIGVISADIGLHMPDFRAAERTFQLLTQVAGRAGRAETPGRVVLQSFLPDHYAIRPVLQHDYERFYREETGHRRSLGFPPFGRITQVMVSSEEDEAAAKAAEALASTARAEIGEPPPGSATAGSAAVAPPACEVLGPAPAPLPRLRGRYRHQLLVKGWDEQAVQRVSRRLAQAARRLPRDVQALVDVDPVNML